VVVRVEGRPGPPAGSGLRSLPGITATGSRITLKLDRRGRVAGVVARLRSVCRGGHTWSIRWSPLEGSPIHFRHRGNYVTAVEGATRLRGKAQQQISTGFDGRLGHGRASGNVRLVARFWRGARQVQACDSGWVAWAAGPRAEQRLAFVTPPRYLGSYYPAAPTLADHPSRARRRFSARVDRTCVRENRRTRAAWYDAARRRLPPTRVWNAYVRSHVHELDAIRRLGSPPEARPLYAGWVTNLADRVSQEKRIAVLLRRDDLPAARSLLRGVGRSKMTSNDAGQRFGLIVCTANGPDRTPVPF
jgi:hypothetical protein